MELWSQFGIPFSLAAAAVAVWLALEGDDRSYWALAAATAQWALYDFALLTYLTFPIWFVFLACTWALLTPALILRVRPALFVLMLASGVVVIRSFQAYVWDGGLSLAGVSDTVTALLMAGASTKLLETREAGPAVRLDYPPNRLTAETETSTGSEPPPSLGVTGPDANTVSELTCSHCKHVMMAAGSSFCPECGNPVGPHICPDCHTTYPEEAGFCDSCGTALEDFSA